MPRQKEELAHKPLEKQLWSAADKLRKNIDAAEYKRSAWPDFSEIYF